MKLARLVKAGGAMAAAVVAASVSVAVAGGPTPGPTRIDESPPSTVLDGQPLLGLDGEAIKADPLASTDSRVTSTAGTEARTTELLETIAAAGAVVTRTGPWHGAVDTQLMLGAAQRVELATPMDLRSCCFPQVNFPDGSDSYLPYQIGYAAKGLRAVDVLIDTSGVVVSVTPIDFDSLRMVQPPPGPAVNAAESVKRKNGASR